MTTSVTKMTPKHTGNMFGITLSEPTEPEPKPDAKTASDEPQFPDKAPVLPVEDPKVPVEDAAPSVQIDQAIRTLQGVGLGVSPQHLVHLVPLHPVTQLQAPRRCPSLAKSKWHCKLT